MDLVSEKKIEDQEPGYNYPRSLLRKPNGTGKVKFLDGSGLSEPMKNLLRLAAAHEPIPNCDSLLYFPENFKNWSLIAADRKDNGEEDSIRRASAAHAAIVHPPETFGLWSIGPGDQFGVKERALIEEHVARGHEFSFFAYSDVNEASLERSIEDGKKVAADLGLKNVDHVKLLGDIYDKDVQKRNKKILLESKVLATCFGFTIQNLNAPVSGYTEATEEMTKALKQIKKCLSEDSRFFVTIDHEVDKETILPSYEGKAHDAFLNAAIAHHLLPEIAEMAAPDRRFVPNTAILNRKAKADQSFAISLGDDTVIITKGSPIWNGISAKIPPHYAKTSFEKARFHPVMDPVFGPGKQVGCHVHRTP